MTWNGFSFVAMIRKNGKQTYIGSFLTAEEAARVYDEEAKKHYGEFARINGV